MITVETSLQKNIETYRTTTFVHNTDVATTREDNVPDISDSSQQAKVKETRTETTGNSENVTKTFIDDLNLTSVRLDCGAFKCFVPSVSDRNIGYLISKVESLERAKHAYDVAKWIEKAFGGKHFYLDDHEPPFQAFFPKKVREMINQKVFFLHFHTYHWQFLEKLS